MLDIATFDPDMLIVKKPVFLGYDENGHDRYSSEIWYKPKLPDTQPETPDTVPISKPFRPIFRTPRIKIQYSCKRFAKGYSYCISDYNSDIDDEIKGFFDFIRKLDRRLNIIYRQQLRTWGITPTKGKFWSSLKKGNQDTSSSYMPIKVITQEDEQGEFIPCSKIHTSNGAPLTPEDIKYGCFSDQLISISYLYYSHDGIRPVWYTHQTVVSSMSHVFLEYCLLDDIWKPMKPLTYQIPPPPPMYQGMPYVPQAPPAPPMPPGLQSHQAPSPLSLIKKGDLLAAIGKLRSVQGSDRDNDENVSGITATMLQDKKKANSTKAILANL